MRKYLLVLLAMTTCLSAKGFGYNLSFGIDYLFWNATQSNMTYAIVVDSRDTLNKINAENQGSKWSSGVRLAVNTCWQECADLKFAWTHFYNHTKSSVATPFIIATQIFTGNGLFVGGDGVGGPAKSRWNLQLDMFDIEGGFNLMEQCGCLLHPYVGIKGGTINQNQTIQYINFTNDSTRINVLIDQTNNFWGLGPKAGFTALFKLYSTFEIEGNFAMASLIGNHCSPTTIQIKNPANIENHRLNHNKFKLIPTLQLSLGAGWQALQHECFCLAFNLSYEIQHFWNTWRLQNSFIQDIFVNDVGYGSLTLHGLVVRATLGF